MNTDEAPQTDATSALAEAIDDFIGDIEKKFKVVSDEILTKRTFPQSLADVRLLTVSSTVDDMAERCDRIEAELLMRDAAGSGTSKSEPEGGSQ